jgi:hypothetical protein
MGRGMAGEKKWAEESTWQHWRGGRDESSFAAVAHGHRLTRNGRLSSPTPTPYAPAIWYGEGDRQFVFVGNPTAMKKSSVRFPTSRHEG